MMRGAGLEDISKASLENISMDILENISKATPTTSLPCCCQYSTITVLSSII